MLETEFIIFWKGGLGIPIIKCRTIVECCRRGRPVDLSDSFEQTGDENDGALWGELHGKMG